MKKMIVSGTRSSIFSIFVWIVLLLSLVICNEDALSAPSVKLVGGKYFLKIDGEIFKVSSAGTQKVKYYNTDHTAKKNAVNKAFECNGCSVEIHQTAIRVTATYDAPDPVVCPPIPDTVLCPAIPDTVECPTLPQPETPSCGDSSGGLEEYPTDWLFTAAGSSLAEDTSTFEILPQPDGNTVLASAVSSPNIHAHLRGGSAEVESCDYTGRMMIAQSSTSGLGLTFGSDYPDSDTYYRIRMTPTHKTFYVAPHNADISGDIESNFLPKAREWTNFHVRVDNSETETRIRAKFWEGEGETEWSIDATDNTADRIKTCGVGVWSMGAKGNQWDDLSIQLNQELETSPDTEEPELGAIQLSWDIPTERNDGSDLPKNEIKGYTIRFSVKGNPNGAAETFVSGADTLTFTYGNLPANTYVFVIRTVDSDNVAGDWSCDITNEDTCLTQVIQ